MTSVEMKDVVKLDDTDRRVLRALQLDGRAPFSRIADVLGVSEQTISRRYRRMRDAGVVRVTGQIDERRLGQSGWVVRVQCRPDATIRLATALAQRDDVAWVSMTAGGSEIVCAVRSRTAEARDELLLSRLPNTNQVLSLSVHAIMRHFTIGWSGFGGMLVAQQQRALKYRPERHATPTTLTPEDEPLLAALARDGRTPFAAMADGTWTEGRLARRVETLRASGMLYFDVDLSAQLLGYLTPAHLWLTVEPAHLAAVARTISRHAEVPFVAAISGSVNLMMSAWCVDIDELYQYVTTKLGKVPGIRQIEVSPVLRRLKQAGAMMVGGRLVDLPSRPSQANRTG